MITLIAGHTADPHVELIGLRLPGWTAQYERRIYEHLVQALLSALRESPEGVLTEEEPDRCVAHAPTTGRFFELFTEDDALVDLARTVDPKEATSYETRSTLPRTPPSGD